MSATILLLLKLVHIWSVIMFVGNSALGPYRRRQARLTGKAQVIAGTYEIHTRSGRDVTIPWFAATLATGLVLAWLSDIPILGTGWVVLALVLSVAVALLFVVRIAPLQRQATAEAVLLASEGPEREAAFRQAARRLEPWSHFAHVIFVAIIALMVFKPPVPLPW